MVICTYEGCSKKASYNFLGKKGAIFCSEHKADGMFDNINKKCEEPGCIKIPSSNFIGEKRAIFCASHKTIGMTNIITKRCMEDGCCKIREYNNSGEKTPLFCKSHSSFGMINVRRPTCLEKGCRKSRIFNIPGESSALFCATHKGDNMINVITRVCEYINCNTRPIYNNPGELRGVFCRIHKTDIMVDVLNKKCSYPDCTRQPSYNILGSERAIFCSVHKKGDMVDVRKKKCKSYLCDTHALKKYEGYCVWCYVHLYPDKKKCRNYKTKETSIVEFVMSSFPEFEWIADKRIPEGCSLRRPDLLLDLGYQVIIIEIDEHQHGSYECICENKRIMQLSQDINHRPLVCIRFNPDAFDEEKSCWTVNSFGFSVIAKTRIEEWATRLEKLKEQIQYWTNPDNAFSGILFPVHMFFSKNIDL